MDRQAQGDVATHKPSEYARRFAYDSIVHVGNSLRLLADVGGIDQIMLGTDYSFPPADLAPLRTLHEAGFSAQDIDKIAEQNPRRIFRLS
jgi:aminocarboxymuconate-semialdehyde decarboxylase